MMVFRPYLAAMLALVLVVTGQSMALARVAPGPAGSIVLCTGTGPVTVLVDETGTPMDAGHICPDCAMGLFAATLPGMPDMPRRLSHPCTVTAPAPPVLSDTGGLFFSRARAPPAQD